MEAEVRKTWEWLKSTKPEQQMTEKKAIKKLDVIVEKKEEYDNLDY